MTNEELMAAQAQIATADTEIAALTLTERDCIEKAREFNDARRVASLKRTGLINAITPLKAAVAQHLQEAAIAAKRLVNEQKAKEAADLAEQQAAVELAEVDQLKARVAELEAQVAAK